MENTPITIDAVYSGGVLRPLLPVEIPENQRVRLTIAPLGLPIDVAEWLATTAAHREAMFLESGYCYDSTELVAAERRRDG